MSDPTTNAATRRAFEEHRIVRQRTSDPDTTDLDGGEIWYRTDTNEFRGYVAGTGVVTLNTTAV